MEWYQIITVLLSFIGAILGGALIPWFNSKKDRESREQIFQEEMGHKIKMFELEKTHKEDMFNLEKEERQKRFEMERKDKYRMVAIEKRLQAHQEAFVQWHLLRDILHSNDGDDNKRKVLQNATDFWIKSSLYLEPNTRKKFKDAIYIADFYKSNLLRTKSSDPKILEDERKEIMKDWDAFFDLAKLISSEVELEPIVLSDEKFDAFGNKNEI